MNSDLADSHSLHTGAALPLDRLSDWLEQHLTGFAGPLSVERFTGGQSNPTYKLITPLQSYVLRRKPGGPLLKGAHAIEREFRVTEALGNAGFPVARPLALCTDEHVIGSAFYVMELAEGRIFWDASLPGLEPEQRQHYFDALNTTLSTLHSYDVTQLALQDFGKPGNYFSRQISRWSRQYSEDPAAGSNRDMDALLHWLPAHIPADEQSSVIHGDFRADNVVFHPSKPQVVAVLDWELSTLGHPLADFTYHLMMYHLPPRVLGGFQGLNLAALGIPSEEDYVAKYCRHTGRTGITHLNFYLAFNMFRFAAILHGIRGRIARGTASSTHAHSIADNFPLLAQLAWAQATS